MIHVYKVDEIIIFRWCRHVTDCFHKALYLIHCLTAVYELLCTDADSQIFIHIYMNKTKLLIIYVNFYLLLVFTGHSK